MSAGGRKGGKSYQEHYLKGLPRIDMESSAMNKAVV